jgi:hypothetical protein
VATAAKDQPTDAGEQGKFKRDLTLLVLDKLVFGLLIVIAAFLFNRILDQHRAHITFEAEFAKERADRVAGLLTLEAQRDSVLLQLTAAELRAVDFLHEQDAALAAHRTKALDAAVRGLDRSGTQITHALDVLGRLKEIRPVLDADRFWLGRTLYARIANHVALEQRLERRVSSGNPHVLEDEIGTIRQLQAEARNPLDIDEVTSILSSGG